MKGINIKQKEIVHLKIFMLWSVIQEKNIKNLAKVLLEVSEQENISFCSLVDDFMMYGAKYLEIEAKRRIEEVRRVTKENYKIIGRPNKEYKKLSKDIITKSVTEA